jgi:hypothetical protein
MREPNFSIKEESDVKELESGTKELFMGQTNAPEDEMEKEMQEFLDAKNKEVLRQFNTLLLSSIFTSIF